MSVAEKKKKELSDESSSEDEHLGPPSDDESSSDYDYSHGVLCECDYCWWMYQGD